MRRWWAGAGICLAIVAALGALVRAAHTSRDRSASYESACTETTRIPGPRPNVILISIDTLRADRLGAYGYEQARTPRIDALAATGVRFANATAPIPRTTPALASLLTGLEPRHHGAREVGEKIGTGPTLASVLCEAGYATRAVAANEVAGPAQNLHHGFQKFVMDPNVAESLRGRVPALLRDVPGDVPVFLWVHFMDPHMPYFPPLGAPQPLAWGCRRMIYEFLLDDRKGRFFVDQAAVASSVIEDCRVLYDAEIAYVDTQVGALLDGLEAEGRLENALVIVTADHGENFGEDGLYYEHGPSLHDASLRVPLILNGAGVPSGRVDEGVARLEDVMPTILARVAHPPGRRPPTDGVDLLDPQTTRPDIALVEAASALHVDMVTYLGSGRAEARHCLNGPRYSVCGEPGAEPGLYDRRNDPALRRDVSARAPEARRVLLAAARSWPPESARQRAARGHRFKLVETPLLEGGYRRELFDLHADPTERNDVGERYPEARSRLGAALDEWIATLESRKPLDLDAEQIESLRTLGYVD